MIDLAPNNPNGLELGSPVLVAPGCAEGILRSPAAAGLGALATRWARLAPRAAATRWGSSPAGIVFEQLPETRLATLLGSQLKRWQRAPAPVLLALRGDRNELGEMAQLLEPVEGIAGLLIDANESTWSTVVQALRLSTQLPLLALLPAAGAIEERAQEAAVAGVDALVVRAYPPATAFLDAALVEGMLVGPALAPLTLEAVRAARAAVDLPLIALGGVVGTAIARAVLAAGASAIFVDGALHGDPQLAAAIAAELRMENGELRKED